VKLDQPRCPDCADAGWIVESWHDRAEQDVPLPAWVLEGMPVARRQALLDAAGGDPAKVRLWKDGYGKPMSQARRCLCVGRRREGA